MTRYRSVDCLRGLAAVIVVVHHCLLTSVVLAATYRGGHTSGWGLSEILTRTPLHLIWDGTGMVLVFFVLSGFVLTLASIKPGVQRWSSYYVKRLPRLYLPVWASLALAAVVATAVPRVATNAQSWWINAHASAATLTSVARDATLIWPPSLLNSPLWSLQWEVAFSLMLPAYVVLATRWRRLVWLKVAGALVLIGVGSWSGHASLLYLPVFLLGAVLAADRDRLSAATARLGSRFWLGTCALAVLLLTIDDIAGPLAEWISRPLRSLGAAVVVLVFLNWRACGRFADRRAMQWLGRISFSLYLVHEPIVVSVDRLLPGSNAFEVLVIAMPMSLALAAAFYRLVEAPSLTVAHWFGRLESTPSQFWAAGDPAT